MTTCFIRKLLFILGLFSLTAANSQENFTGYFQPQISLNYKVATNYSHSFALSLRNYVYETEELQLGTRQLDIAHFSKLKINNGQSLAFGVLYRFRTNFESDEENELRLTQQYNITHKPRIGRFVHRLRAEQRINPSLTTHRFRYQFAIALPLNGQLLDLGEPYFTISTEALLSVANKKNPQYDQRITVNIGWLVSEMAKLQGGIEYRVEDYTRQNEHVLFLLTSLIFKL